MSDDVPRGSLHFNHKLLTPGRTRAVWMPPRYKLLLLLFLFFVFFQKNFLREGDDLSCVVFETVASVIISSCESHRVRWNVFHFQMSLIQLS